MISSLIKSIMAERRMGQRELAAALDVSIDRVKSLTSGRAKKLAPAEIRALVERLNVRAEYLATGEPPIFRPVDATGESEKTTLSDAIRGLAESIPSYHRADGPDAQTDTPPTHPTEPSASAELGLLGRAIAITDQALAAARLRSLVDSGQYAALCVVAFALLARRMPASEVREVVDRVLEIGAANSA